MQVSTKTWEQPGGWGYEVAVGGKVMARGARTEEHLAELAARVEETFLRTAAGLERRHAQRLGEVAAAG